MWTRSIGKQSISLRDESYLAGTESADLAMIITRIADPIKVTARMFEVLTNIRQNPVIPQA
tara:strand:+ start:691 stop:873 length:183 start_codon:yes stop_codon:yes gene_type:complete